MKSLYTLFLLSLMAISLSAQVEANPNPASKTGSSAEFSYKAIINVKNVSDETLNILWVRDLGGIPAEWTNLICDANLCYAPSTDECPADKPSTIAAGDSADFFIEIRPNNFDADGTVLLNLFEQSNGEALGTLTANFSLMTSAANNVGYDPTVVLYPNPSVEITQIKSDADVAEIQVVNAEGRIVKTIRNLAAQNIDGSDLEPGQYFVRMFDQDGRLISVKPLIKQ